MNREDLIDLLMDAGLDRQEAESRALQFNTDRELEDRLQKSLDALEDVQTAQVEAQEQAQERLSKAFEDGENSIATTIAPALDAMVKETREQNMALCKSFAGILEIMKSVREELKTLRSTPSPAQAQEVMAKSVDYIPSPYDQAPNSDARDDLFKALTATKVESATQASELLQMATLLESGVSPQEIKTRYPNFGGDQ